MEAIILKAIEQLPNMAIAIVVIWWFMQRFAETLSDNKTTLDKLYALIENLIDRLDNEQSQ